MRKKPALLLVLAMIFALFAACGKGANPAAPTEPPASPTENLPVEPVDEGSNKLAKGKVELDEEGWPTSGYDYDLPFCESGETIKYWTVCWTPQLLPDDPSS